MGGISRQLHLGFREEMKWVLELRERQSAGCTWPMTFCLHNKGNIGNIYLIWRDSSDDPTVHVMWRSFSSLLITAVSSCLSFDAQMKETLHSRVSYHTRPSSHVKLWMRLGKKQQRFDVLLVIASNINVTHSIPMCDLLLLLLQQRHLVDQSQYLKHTGTRTNWN